MPELPDAAPEPLAPDVLRWRCDPAALGFTSTAELDPIPGIIGQDEAVDALRFGLEIHAPGQNIYVRGLKGTGRLTTVRKLLEEIRPGSPAAPDHLYVHDFDHPDRPKLISVERGRGELFCEKLDELRQFIVGELGAALSGELITSRRKQIEQQTLAEVHARTEPLEAELAEAGLALVIREAGGVAQPLILPAIDGKPVAPERFAEMVASGELSKDAVEQLEERSKSARERVDRVFREVAGIQRELRDRIRELLRTEAEALLQGASNELREAFPSPRVQAWLDALIRDVVHRRLGELDEIEEHAALYEANPLSCHAADEPSPVIVESVGTMRSLLGTIDATVTPEGRARTDHMAVRAGSLVQADGGVLVLEATEVLTHPGAWSALVRTLRSGRVELVMPELPVLVPITSLKPEPIPVNVKVVLLGDAQLYYLLDQLDNDFPHLFKVLADFDELIPRTAQSVELYARVFTRIAAEEQLPAFSCSAIAELAEHGARVASLGDKLTARVGRLADIAREAAFLARKQADPDATIEVAGEHVREAVRRTKRRGDLPARRFREMVATGRIRITTEGRAVGQINGLAVIQAGPLIYGFPTRITATVGAGIGGTVNIEREAELSGAIHTKSFFILGGLLRRLLQSEHPLTFDASIAFEQSYGGIDGDSASGAEIVCLLSALINEPIRQDLAMTGAIDQVGNVLPIGAVNEKIEGYFDSCKNAGLTGTQGVVIPAANVGDLMLRHDVVEACARGEFHVWAVARIHEAIALYFGQPAGERDPATGFYPEGSVLHAAVMSAFLLWQRAQAKPEDFELVERGEDGSANTPSQ
ncbi:MAG: ATP-binding protein [Enhygromyxa sp.]